MSHARDIVLRQNLEIGKITSGLRWEKQQSSLGVGGKLHRENGMLTRSRWIDKIYTVAWVMTVSFPRGGRKNYEQRKLRECRICTESRKMPQ